MGTKLRLATPSIDAQLEHIRDMKRNTWTITNYGLLLYGAIFAVFRAINKPPESLLSLAKVEIFAIAIIGTVLLVTVQYDLATARMALQDDNKACTRGWQFLLALILTLWGGAALLWFSLPYLST